MIRDVAQANLGDYYSWGVRHGRDLILTITGSYYYLEHGRALPPQKIPPCPGIGSGARPLLSKDGMRATTFVDGTIVVRNLTDCDDIVGTGVQGAKADFSWDGRYIAFHAPKKDFSGYEIRVVDLARRTVRTVTSLRGSSLFPSWTRDGRLCFRYDGPDYRGFIMASGVTAAPAEALPVSGLRRGARPAWADVFAQPRPARAGLDLVLVWSTWSAHSPAALADLRRAKWELDRRGVPVGVWTALDLSSQRDDADRMRREAGVSLPELTLQRDNFGLTGAVNQMPTMLLFRDGVQLDERLGAHTSTDILDWVAGQR